MKKKLHQLILTSILVFIAFNAHASINSGRKHDEALKAKVAAMTDAQKDARYEEMKARVEEIKKTDKSTLTKAERKDLKNELRSMQKEANAIGHGGIYLSFAGIVIIILLLILIL